MKDMATLVTTSRQRGKLDSNTIEEEDKFELKARTDWKKQNVKGLHSVHYKHHQHNAPSVNESLIVEQMEYYLTLTWTMRVQSKNHGAVVGLLREYVMDLGL